MFCVADSLEKAGDLEKSGKEYFCAKNLENGIWWNQKNEFCIYFYCKNTNILSLILFEKFNLEKPNEKCTFETWKLNLGPLVGRPRCIKCFFINLRSNFYSQKQCCGGDADKLTPISWMTEIILRTDAGCLLTQISYLKFTFCLYKLETPAAMCHVLNPILIPKFLKVSYWK